MRRGKPKVYDKPCVKRVSAAGGSFFADMHRLGGKGFEDAALGDRAVAALPDERF